ncbi:HNH endonuclease [Aerococcus sp. UMB8608]|uniref:Endonuclease n=1 Tax=Aerococcus sanguinicola TaxID=119206 RepID=A0A0X8FD22_9LACT|nr:MULTISPECIES: HNH endonuclease [Aerococcus]AMB94909.1 endonuclease [Aerococcus sanguinicola]MDK6679358.1 HNH endonuclease [Aerococcus sp. UMB8608]MDK6685800.1 HNH endonuclease [Aerococcus sp. UMB8623]OFT95894.1 endonuclease [Aerococcus sp. HMSC23C02]
MKKVNPFYRTAKWQKKRELTLRRYNYLSAEAKQFGRHEPAEMIHHIYPLSEYPELALVDWNLLPLTNKEHNGFHDRKTDKIIGRGLYWQQKRRKEFEKFFDRPP